MWVGSLQLHCLKINNNQEKKESPTHEKDGGGESLEHPLLIEHEAEMDIRMLCDSNYTKFCERLRYRDGATERLLTWGGKRRRQATQRILGQDRHPVGDPSESTQQTSGLHHIAGGHPYSVSK